MMMNQSEVEIYLRSFFWANRTLLSSKLSPLVGCDPLFKQRNLVSQSDHQQKHDTSAQDQTWKT